MTKQEANEMLMERFEQLNNAATAINDCENSMELCALCDSAHKIYITLCNAGAFESELNMSGSGGIMS